MDIPTILVPGIKGTTLVNTNTLDFDTIWSAIQSKFETIFDLELQLDPRFETEKKAIIERSDVEDLAYREAVAIGMVAETKLAERLSMAVVGLSDTLVETLSGLGLPVEIPENLPCTELVHAMKMDKKKSEGIVRFSLPVKIGEVKVGIEINNLISVLEEDK